MTKYLCVKTIHNKPCKVIAFGSRKFYSVVPLKTYNRTSMYYVPDSYIVEIIYANFKVHVKTHVNEIGMVSYSALICDFQTEFLHGLRLNQVIHDCFAKYMKPVSKLRTVLDLHHIGISVSAVQNILHSELELKPFDKMHIRTQPEVGQVLTKSFVLPSNHAAYKETVKRSLQRILRKEAQKCAGKII